jgi:hypothetical protein
VFQANIDRKLGKIYNLLLNEQSKRNGQGKARESFVLKLSSSRDNPARSFLIIQIREIWNLIVSVEFKSGKLLLKMEPASPDGTLSLSPFAEPPPLAALEEQLNREPESIVQIVAEAIQQVRPVISSFFL